MHLPVNESNRTQAFLCVIAKLLYSARMRSNISSTFLKPSSLAFLRQSASYFMELWKADAGTHFIMQKKCCLDVDIILHSESLGTHETVMQALGKHYLLTIANPPSYCLAKCFQNAQYSTLKVDFVDVDPQPLRHLDELSCIDNTRHTCRPKSCCCSYRSCPKYDQSDSHRNSSALTSTSGRCLEVLRCVSQTSWRHRDLLK
jgi:hypothetical protein